MGYWWGPRTGVPGPEGEARVKAVGQDRVPGPDSRKGFHDWGSRPGVPGGGGWAPGNFPSMDRVPGPDSRTGFQDQAIFHVRVPGPDSGTGFHDRGSRPVVPGGGNGRKKGKEGGEGWEEGRKEEKV